MSAVLHNFTVEMGDLTDRLSQARHLIELIWMAAQAPNSEPKQSAAMTTACDMIEEIMLDVREGFDDLRARMTEDGPADPLVVLLDEHRAQAAVFAAKAGELQNDEEEQAMVEATYGPAQRTLCKDAPLPTSLAGVAAAIRNAFELDALIDDMAKGPLKAALAYLDGEGSAS